MDEQQELTGTEVARVKDDLPATRDGMEIGRLMEIALERDSVDSLKELVELKKQVMDWEAETAMAEALAGFQADCPPIPRVGTADVRKNGQRVYGYQYATLDKIIEVIRPHLSEYGLSYTHDFEVADGGQVVVTCTLQHVMGATRTATFRGPVDTSGGKNPLQAVGSSRSYGRRYTLVDVLGLATEEDDDGQGAGSEAETISDAQLKKLNALADKAGADKAAFCRLVGVESMAAIPASQFQWAELTLRKKLDAKEADDE